MGAWHLMTIQDSGLVLHVATSEKGECMNLHPLVILAIHPKPKLHDFSGTVSVPRRGTVRVAFLDDPKSQVQPLQDRWGGGQRL